MNKDIQVLENNIAYVFKDRELLKNAIRHSSFAHENRMTYADNNERLEFLGDAILELVSSEYVFKNNPSMVEGEMTKLRASLVCEVSLAMSARQIDLGDFLLLSKGERKNNGHEKDSLLSDAFEAVIGAIYLDGGFQEAKKFIEKFVLVDIEKRIKVAYDNKTRLQEIVQEIYHDKSSIMYNLISEEGPAHNMIFTVECTINGEKFGKGSGKKKKTAEQAAAYETINMLKKKNLLN